MTQTELDRHVRHRLAVLQHAEEVTGNVAMTCRYYGISRQLFYIWKRRFEEEGEQGVVPRSRRPKVSPRATHVDVVGTSSQGRHGSMARLRGPTGSTPRSSIDCSTERSSTTRRSSTTSSRSGRTTTTTIAPTAALTAKPPTSDYARRPRLGCKPTVSVAHAAGWRGRARTSNLRIQSPSFCQLNYPPPSADASSFSDRAGAAAPCRPTVTPVGQRPRARDEDVAAHLGPGSSTPLTRRSARA
jgi:hypothetical protein